MRRVADRTEGDAVKNADNSTIAQVSLGALAIIGLVGWIVLAALKVDIPAALPTTITACVTGVIGIAVPRGSKTE